MVLTIAYSLSIPYSILVWIGTQSSMSLSWELDVLWFAIIGTVGAISSLAALYKKKWGVYGLVAAWLFTSIQNFVSHILHTLSAPAYHFSLWLVIAFFITLLPAWRDFK